MNPSPDVVLGINAFHGDSSAALVVGGEVVAAVEEERFNREKHWAGFPAASVRFCLEQAGIDAASLGHVAISFDPRAHLWRKAGFVLAHRTSPHALVARLRRTGRSVGLRRRVAAALGVAPGNFSATLHHVEHHRAHAASAFFASPFERAAILSVDGMGDFASTVFGRGDGARIELSGRVFHPHSLGYLYTALTLFLGFQKYGDEYKVMGLAPYGTPRFAGELRRVIVATAGGFELDLSYFTHHRHGIAMTWEGGSPEVAPFWSPKLEALLGPARRPDEPLDDRHRDLAASLQLVTEETIFHLLDVLHRRHPERAVCIAGGCAMNSVAMGKVTGQSPFAELFVPCGAADNGTSLGAALSVWHERLGHARAGSTRGEPARVGRPAVPSAALGPEPSDAAIRAALAALPSGIDVRELDDAAMRSEVVDRLVAGEIVGWFRGRMEFGARALGQRSLLADPRRADMRDIINERIKFRELFRPFAPSVLEEHAADWFEPAQPSPFMDRVLPFRAGRGAEVPAVCHVDGTGRLQTVSREVSPDYWLLIEEFRRRTGVPMVLNTSLNENEPIVNTPAEALACFLRTRMDAIVVGRHLVSRSPIDHVS